MGGHLVQGHVDGLGWLADRQRQEEWELVRFTCAASLSRQMVAKGSVAVDGVSLTLVDVEGGGFSVALIPHTLAKTTLGSKRVGDAVNLETDMLAKYVEKQLLAAGLTLPRSCGRDGLRGSSPTKADMIESGSSRQTLSYLRNLLEARGIRPKSKLGQCFLIDLNLIDLLIRTAELSRDDLVLEVGTGTGGLSVQLAERAGAVVSIEIDPAFYELAKSAVFGRENVTLLQADVLRNKNEINPELLAVLKDVRQQRGVSRVKLVANLPYVIATPVLGNLLLSSLEMERMVVTVQWEIALRLTATPGTKDYGALSVLRAEPGGH